MQDRPNAAEFLEIIGDLLETKVLSGVDGLLKHEVRVAGNLCRVLEREVGLSADLDQRETERLRTLLFDRVEGGESTVLLNDLLAKRLSGEVTHEFQSAAWHVLLANVRGKLSIMKPGYDLYDFSPELDC